MRKIKKGRNKKAKALYDALRYRKKKLINLIEDLGKKAKNIYDNKYSRKSLLDYTKADIEALYKKAVFEKDKEAQRIIKKLGAEYKGPASRTTSKFADILEEDLIKNIYGTRPSKLRVASKNDFENFKRLLNGLTPEQKLEFLNSASYYGARRYQKPPAESETFNLQVEQDGASYIVQDLVKYYKDKGLSLPQLLSTNGRKPKGTTRKQRERKIKIEKQKKMDKEAGII